jgi:hypothetical protein
VLLLTALQLAGASHVVVHRSLEAEAAAAPPSVPASIVSPLLRTGYHFQPPMNWINGTLATYLEVGMITPPAALRLALLISPCVFSIKLLMRSSCCLLYYKRLTCVTVSQTMDTEC